MSQGRERQSAFRKGRLAPPSRPSLAIAEAEALVGQALAVAPEVAQAWCLSPPSGQSLVVLAHQARQGPPTLALPPEVPWALILEGLGGPAPHLELTQLVVGGRAFRWWVGARGILVLQGGPAWARTSLGPGLLQLAQGLSPPGPT